MAGLHDRRCEQHGYGSERRYEAERGRPEGPGSIDERAHMIDHEAFDMAVGQTVQRREQREDTTGMSHVRLH